ncbi:thioredoxin domain-containing protein [Chondromyces apiculatus]|uniref:thioredoxin domain-containing protein n=1 Tax=Chondromyces apiculatus TaxID=51 RepID=UPI001E543F43|nr:thioredoxin domain-containing protein [Chondromyces apiculatus]
MTTPKIASALPGAPDVPEDVARRLDEALSRKGPGYVPRTHHLEGGWPVYTNRLVLEGSPYLLQHAHNPVNWFPWGEEAFEEARRLERPVMISIGYSTCHWCHVMERESFEDVEIARFLNENYVCIKVDREERPDVDAIYMSAVQALTGSGGWPLNVFLTPDKAPFFGGTYFPPRDGARGMRKGFLTILAELLEVYTKDRERIDRAAADLTGIVRDLLSAQAAPADVDVPDAGPIASALRAYKRGFDSTHGGLARAPKFPSQLPPRLLLRVNRRANDAEALHMATLTLAKMAGGGMYDQVGGGFHRYSTDPEWLVPHFEKMLYDNALLAVAYAEAHQATGRADFARVTREVLDYVLREMTSPEGGFYSATDADSEGEEGLFFVWTPAELREALGADADRFMRYYGVTEAGNFEGRTILHASAPDEAEHAALASARETLYALRAKRIPPLRDDKVLTSWNGLMISGFAVAAQALGEPRYAEAGARAAAFLLERMREGDRLRRSFLDGKAQFNGYLDDYAFLIQGLLDLHEATFEARWLHEAIALAEVVEAHYADRSSGGWFMTSDDHEQLLAREKPGYDGAEPSGNSVHLLNVLRLGELTGEDRYREMGARALKAFAAQLTERPLALSDMLLALDFWTDTPREVVVVWPDGEAAPKALLDVLGRTFLPSRVITGGPESTLAALAKAAPIVEGKRTVDGKPTVYVCERGRCEAPTTDPGVLAAQLGQVKAY